VVDRVAWQGARGPTSTGSRKKAQDGQFWGRAVGQTKFCSNRPYILYFYYVEVGEPEASTSADVKFYSSRTQKGHRMPFPSYRGPRKECDNPICHREVDVGVMYCCKACGDAHEGGYKLGPPGFQIGVMAHSPTCDKRAYEGEWSDKSEEA